MTGAPGGGGVGGGWGGVGSVPDPSPGFYIWEGPPLSFPRSIGIVESSDTERFMYYAMTLMNLTRTQAASVPYKSSSCLWGSWVAGLQVSGAAFRSPGP